MNNQTLVNNIKKLCKDNNISTSMLEKELLMSPGLISRWSKNMPTLDRVMEIANFFHVSLDELIGNANDEQGSDNRNINKLIVTLYNKSVEAEIEWQVFNPVNASDGINTKKIASIINLKNMDCFFCDVNNGNFILTITYNGKEKDLALYVLADQYSFPELRCSNNEKLNNLYRYLLKRLSNQLNKIKTNNFINDFINQNNNVISKDNITVLKTAVNE